MKLAQNRTSCHLALDQINEWSEKRAAIDTCIREIQIQRELDIKRLSEIRIHLHQSDGNWKNAAAAAAAHTNSICAR